jgi:hypothetical protein
VYKNTKNLSARAWADENKSVSNIGLKVGDITDATIQGAKGIRYDVDGLYRAQTLVVTSNGYVYIISASYLDENSATYKDFASILGAFLFFTPR